MQNRAHSMAEERSPSSMHTVLSLYLALCTMCVRIVYTLKYSRLKSFSISKTTAITAITATSQCVNNFTSCFFLLRSLCLFFDMI